MKSLHYMIVGLFVIATATGVAQDGKNTETAQAPLHRWSAGINAGGGTGNGDGLVTLGASLSRSVTPWLDLGVSLQAFSETTETYEDAIGRTYHRESGYSALLIRPRVQLTERIELALPIETGSGIMIYRYDSKYAEDLRWTDEILDQLTYGVYSAGLETRIDVGTRLAVSLAGGYRGTSPLRTDLADRNALTGPWGRAGVVYRF